MGKGILMLKLKQTRLSRNLSQTNAAKEIGVGYATYSRLENNANAKPSYEVVEKIAKWLHVEAREVREWL